MIIESLENNQPWFNDISNNIYSRWYRGNDLSYCEYKNDVDDTDVFYLEYGCNGYRAKFQFYDKSDFYDVLDHLLEHFEDLLVIDGLYHIENDIPIMEHDGVKYTPRDLICQCRKYECNEQSIQSFLEDNNFQRLLEIYDKGYILYFKDMVYNGFCMKIDIPNDVHTCIQHSDIFPYLNCSKCLNLYLKLLDILDEHKKIINNPNKTFEFNITRRLSKNVHEYTLKYDFVRHICVGDNLLELLEFIWKNYNLPNPDTLDDLAKFIKSNVSAKSARNI